MSIICVRIEDDSDEEALLEKVKIAVKTLAPGIKIESAEVIGPMKIATMEGVTEKQMSDHNFETCENLANWRYIRDRGPEAVQQCAAERLFEIMRILTFVAANCDEMRDSTTENSFLEKFQDACETGIDEAAALAEVLGVDPFAASPEVPTRTLADSRGVDPRTGNPKITQGETVAVREKIKKARKP